MRREVADRTVLYRHGVRYSSTAEVDMEDTHVLFILLERTVPST